MERGAHLQQRSAPGRPDGDAPVAGASRQVKLEKGALEDARITADNIAYFGEPAYSYDISQAVEDGYLAVCEIVRRDVFLQTKTANERETGLDASDLTNVIDPITGRPGMAEDGAHYEAESFEADIVLPERTKAMAEDLFRHMLATGGPHQKTIVFCVRDLHAEQVAPAMNNLYAAWRQARGRMPASGPTPTRSNARRNPGVPR